MISCGWLLVRGKKSTKNLLVKFAQDTMKPMYFGCSLAKGPTVVVFYLNFFLQ